jgi:hypothetical protein
LLSTVSKRYVAAVDELALADPDIPVEELASVPEVTFVKRN